MYEHQPDVDKYQKQKAVNEIIQDPGKLKQFAMGEYKEQIKKLDHYGIGYIFD